MSSAGMMAEGWMVEAEAQAGEVWTAVARHPAVAELNRTHCLPRLALGLRLSRGGEPVHGRFLSTRADGEFRTLGRVVAAPAGASLQVVGGAEPLRRMLHCQIPDRVGLEPDSRLLAACLDVRSTVITAGLTRLAQETTAPGFASHAVIEGLGLLLAAEVARVVAGARERRGPTRGGLAAWQLRRIEEHLRSGHWDCAVGDLAQLCGLSPSHTMRAFRQSTGRTLAAHIADLRIARACELLAEPRLSVAEIAQDLRFAQPSAFAAAFRRATGVSPRRYRQARLAG